MYQTIKLAFQYSLENNMIQLNNTDYMHQKLKDQYEIKTRQNKVK